MLNNKIHKSRESRCNEHEILIDVLLSNKPELFKHSGNYYSLLSDHALIYGVLKERLNQRKPRIIKAMSLFFSSNIYQLLHGTFVTVFLFDDVDDQANAWNLLMNDILNDLAAIKTM